MNRARKEKGGGKRGERKGLDADLTNISGAFALDTSVMKKENAKCMTDRTR